MLWWQTTKAFMVEKKLAPPFVMDNFYLSKTSGKVNLYWSTSADTTTKYFVVQRGTDASQFKDISGQISPLPDHFSENAYHFTDNDPDQHKTFYRLAIIDKSGTKHYSATISTP
jgi:hypothetical protein